MELTVYRKWKLPTYTIGQLFVDGKYLCDVLEDRDRNLSSDMPTYEIYKKKVYGCTCVPRGRYRIDMTHESHKFANRAWAKPYQGRLPLLVDVPCWTGVLIHVGNSPADTYGCLLPGENKQKGKVINSTKAFYNLMDNYLVPAHQRGEEIWLTIK